MMFLHVHHSTDEKWAMGIPLNALVSPVHVQSNDVVAGQAVEHPERQAREQHEKKKGRYGGESEIVDGWVTVARAVTGLERE